jgi:hypothetical protein
MSNHEGRRRSASGSDSAPSPEAPKREPARETPRVFTISEVNALIPTLNLIVAQQLLDQSDIEQGMAELTRRIGETPLTLEVQPGDDAEISRLKADLRRRIGRYEERWRKVRDLGGIVKGPQIGLVDFQGRIDGRLVWLCWRYGEDSLGYFHELNAGYAGRKPISADVRKSLVN